MTPEQEELVLGLVVVPGRRRRLSKREFVQRLGHDDPSAWALDQLRVAATAHDADGVELSLVVAAVFGAGPAWVDPLVTLAFEPWHHSHEDIATMLGRLGDPRAVPALERLADWVPDHLEFDGSRALRRKALHALRTLQRGQS